MSDRARIAPAATAGPAWWRGELVRFSGRARQWLGKNFPSLQRLFDDLIGETLLQLTHRLDQPAGDLPPAWFAAAEPPDDDVRRFQALALTVLKRRVMDHFRADYRQWASDPQGADEGSREGSGEGAAERAAPGPDSAGALDLARAARALVTLLAELPEADRLLMEEIALGGRDGPLDERERQRVHRLRQRLLERLHERLGHDPLVWLRRL